MDEYRRVSEFGEDFILLTDSQDVRDVAEPFNQHETLPGFVFVRLDPYEVWGSYDHSVPYLDALCELLFSREQFDVDMAVLDMLNQKIRTSHQRVIDLLWWFEHYNKYIRGNIFSLFERRISRLQGGFIKESEHYLRETNKAIEAHRTIQEKWQFLSKD